MSALAGLVESAHPLVAAHAVPDPGPGRFDSMPDRERGFVLEAVHEGFLMHYGGEPRAFSGLDDDLRLLAGDALYALGVARLAEAGDLDAVAELADLISLSAWAQAEGRPELAEEAWEASAARLGAGSQRGARAAVAEQLRAGR